jgi:hypothetical protein
MMKLNNIITKIQSQQKTFESTHFPKVDPTKYLENLVLKKQQSNQKIDVYKLLKKKYH